MAFVSQLKQQEQRRLDAAPLSAERHDPPDGLS